MRAHLIDGASRFDGTPSFYTRAGLAKCPVRTQPYTIVINQEVELPVIRQT